jgi:hypothetical protein
MQGAFRRLSDTIASYAGTTRELRGDALVGEFDRASDAVSAALTLREMRRSLGYLVTETREFGTWRWWHADYRDRGLKFITSQASSHAAARSLHRQHHGVAVAGVATGESQ